MPWQTPTIQNLRQLNRDYIQAQLRSGPMIPNSVLRVMADAGAGLAYLTLLYVDWLAKQLMPDLAETEWLDRHATIWLSNADGSRGRKLASYAQGTATATGIPGTTLPSGSIMSGPTDASGDTISFQTTADAVLNDTPTVVPVIAIDSGTGGNLLPGTPLSLSVAVAGVDSQLVTVSLIGGAEQETDDELRARVLERIQQPPMGGDAEDYVLWSLRVFGVTRVWTSPLEMGVGTVTVRFMMDDLRASSDPSTNGFPLDDDVTAVTNYLQTQRPVAIKDLYIESPIPWPIDCTISDLEGTATQAEVQSSIASMLATKAQPAYCVNGVGQPATTIFAAWVSDAILNTPGVVSFDLTMDDAVPPSNGSLAVLGNVTFQ